MGFRSPLFVLGLAAPAAGAPDGGFRSPLAFWAGGAAVPVVSTAPPSFVEAVFAQETGEAFMVLVTIDHASLEDPIRVAHNAQDVVSRGQTFLAYPFEITLPRQDSEQPPRVTLRIDNISREIIITLRQITSPPTVDVEVVMASTPDVVEFAFLDFTLRDVMADALVVEGELAFEDMLSEPFPGDAFLPGSFPGIF